jgi:hypothetical protein
MREREKIKNSKIDKEKTLKPEFRALSRFFRAFSRFTI